MPHDRASATGLRKMRVTVPVLEDIVRTIGVRHAEEGGALAGYPEDGIVRFFQYDESAERTGGTYSPDYRALNHVLKEEWHPQGIYLLGFVHSHPGGPARPSHGDIEYARVILRNISYLDQLLLPIVLTIPDTGAVQVYPFVAVRKGDDVVIEEMQLVGITEMEFPLPHHLDLKTSTLLHLADDRRAQRRKAKHEADERRGAQRHDDYRVSANGASHNHGHSSVQTIERNDITREETQRSETPGGAQRLALPPGVVHGGGDQTFARVHTAYDLDRLARSRVVCVGVGGGASFVEDLARAGVGEFVLLDPDTVAMPNLATQQVYRRDLGRAKVESLAERVRDINPNVRVYTAAQPLDDLDDVQFEELLFQPLGEHEPVRTLICGLTDQFYAQARVNRLALQFGVPSLNAQVYREGRGAEITFTYPGITTACHRCVLASRYDQYLYREFENDVTSVGTPIFATERLNALKGFMALAILHHGTDHPRWGSLLKRIGPRNLIQIRMDPDIEKALGITTFRRVFAGQKRAKRRGIRLWASPGRSWAQQRILFDETIWLPEKPDAPHKDYPGCLDCGGHGDLLAVRGKIPDTRVLPK